MSPALVRTRLCVNAPGQRSVRCRVADHDWRRRDATIPGASAVINPTRTPDLFITSRPFAVVCWIFGLWFLVSAGCVRSELPSSGHGSGHGQVAARRST